MEGKGSIPHNQTTAKEIVDSSNSLESQLGKDWKQRSISNSVNDIFTPEEMEMIKNKKLPIQDSNSTDIEKWVIEANGVFKSNASSYHASVVEDALGKQKALIEGNIDKDRFYALAPIFLKQNQNKERTLIGFAAEKAGLITQEGKVFNINNLMEERGKETDIVFLTSSGRKPEANMEVSQDGSDDVICILPEDPEGIGTMAHELGHAIRARNRRDNPEQRRIHHEAYKKFEENAKGKGFTPNAQEGLSDEQVRKIKVAEERGAWATGISLIREVGKEIDLEISSTENVGKMIANSETALRTYDEVPYNATSQSSTDKPIPSFSGEMRKTARELREKMKKHNLEYSDLPNFDEATGQAVGNNPRKLIKETEKLIK